MSSTLETLVRLAELEVDERRLVLKAIQEKEDSLKQELINLADRVEKEKEAAQLSMATGLAYAQFINWAKYEKERLEQAIIDLQPELEEARFNLSESFAEQKKVEITKERREEEAKEELKSKEQAFLDEFTITQYRQKQDQ